jgi:antirestriction protein ArdC
MTTTARSRKSPAAKKEAAEKARAERTALLDQLAAFQDELGEDEVTVARIAVWSEKYSENNAVLIVMQAPDATDIRGYRAWQAEGRQVRKGEHGIRILAPAGQSDGVEAKPATDGTPAVEGKDGRHFFRLISVFDLSQTEPV